MTAAEPRWMLLHGAPLDPAGWDEVRRHLPMATVAPDLNRDFPPATLQRDLAAAVLAEEPDGPLVVVGHSLGGQVALEMALLAPDRITRLILVCTRDVPVPEFHEAARALRDGGAVDVEAAIRRWFTADEVAEAGPVVRYARDRLAAVPPRSYATMLQALASYDRRVEVGAIDVPAVLLCGRLDLGCTPEVMATLAADLPGASLHVIDGWAHMSPFADPADFARRLLAAGEAAI